MVSAYAYVRLHAMRSLCPRMIAGMPGKEKPTSLYPAPSSPISYQIEGLRTPRCGSPARMGLPDVVFAPLSAQQFDPTPAPAPGRIARTAAMPGSSEPAESIGE